MGVMHEGPTPHVFWRGHPSEERQRLENRKIESKTRRYPIREELDDGIKSSDGENKNIFCLLISLFLN